MDNEKKADEKAKVPQFPYKREDLSNMTREQQIKARAEMQSYLHIARKNKEAEERRAAFDHANATIASASHSLNGASNNAPAVQPYHSNRGGFHHRGSSRFHPYTRPTPRFQNKSTTFNSSNPTRLSFTAPTHSRPHNLILCPTFSSTGACSSKACRYRHDPERVAVCKFYLTKGVCSKGDSCPFSHNPSAHNVPHCEYFQTNSCTATKCCYQHIRVNSNAKNCHDFGSTGWCERGDKCLAFHAHECPDFANKGFCAYSTNCRYPHVRSAARMRNSPSHTTQIKTENPKPSGGPDMATTSRYWSYPASTNASIRTEDADDSETFFAGDEASESASPSTTAATNSDQDVFTHQSDFISLENLEK